MKDRGYSNKSLTVVVIASSKGILDITEENGRNQSGIAKDVTGR